jgi:hypothetical protein
VEAVRSIVTDDDGADPDPFTTVIEPGDQLLTYIFDPSDDWVMVHGCDPTEMVEPSVLFDRFTMRTVLWPYWPTYSVASSGEVARAIG